MNLRPWGNSKYRTGWIQKWCCDVYWLYCMLFLSYPIQMQIPFLRRDKRNNSNTREFDAALSWWGLLLPLGLVIWVKEFVIIFSSMNGGYFGWTNLNDLSKCYSTDLVIIKYYLESSQSVNYSCNEMKRGITNALLTKVVFFFVPRKQTLASFSTWQQKRAIFKPKETHQILGS